MQPNEIKEIDMLAVMDKLGVQYFNKSWDEYWLYDWSDKTDGRTFNASKGMIVDFSGKGRPQGDIIKFVAEREGLKNKEVFKRFEDNFWQKPNIMQIWRWLPDIDQKKIEYLKTRGIKYEYVKDIVKDFWGIACLVYDRWNPVWLNCRTLSDDHKFRFKALGWYSTSWLYMHHLDDAKDYVIVVEWLIDFLTLRQFETNVVGLKSADNWYDDVIRLWKRIVFIPDNDEAGKKNISKMWKCEIYELPEDCKDINDLHLQKMSPNIVKEILENTKKKLPIERTIKKFLEMQDTMKKNNWMLWFDWPRKEISRQTRGMIAGRVYTIGAFSNVWKSKFAYFFVKHFLEMGKKVLFINLEVWEETCFGEILKAMYGIKSKDLWEVNPNPRDFENLEIVENLYDIDKINETIKASDAEIVVIDYIQNIYSKGSDYERHSNIAREIQKIGIETKKIMLCLSQLSNAMGKEMADETPNFISLKWSWEYFICSDFIFLLRKVDAKDYNMEMILGKNKEGRNDLIYKFKTDLARNQFDCLGLLSKEKTTETEEWIF